MDRTDRFSQADDAELVARALEGVVAAFDALLTRHESRVLRVIRLLGVPIEDREDVAQEVFLRVFRHLDQYRSERDFAGWLYRISVNASRDHRRRKGQRDRLEGPGAGEMDDRRADPGPDPGEQLELLDRRRTLERAVGELPERERVVFVLREMEGLSTERVARALGIARVTVRRHLSRAREHLQDRLLGGAEKKIEESADSIERLGARRSS